MNKLIKWLSYKTKINPINMKFLIFVLALSVLSCYAAPEEKDYFLARITFYTDCPIYGKKTASQAIAKEGTTVAAAKSVPFHTEYFIPRLQEWMKTDGHFKVHDRGPAVDTMVASQGKYPVIDVYVSSKEKVRQYGGRSGNIFKVYKN